MVPKLTLGRTGLRVSRLGLGGFPFGAVNRARGWDPYTDDGRRTAIRTIQAALDAGINYIDTAPGYGQGHSETVLGQALRGRRDDVVLASKVGYRLGPDAVVQSVEASLERLDTDDLDVIQFHGGMYETRDVEHIVEHGLLDALERLRDAGKVRFLGFTAEEPWTARPLIATGRFDVVQLRYNLIYQAAALHALDEAQAAGMGVAVMRPLTSGILQRIAAHLAPGWQQAHDLNEVALKFVLADRRVHVANVGMRWPQEVYANVQLAATFEPPLEIAELPRLTAGVYRSEDEQLDYNDM